MRILFPSEPILLQRFESDIQIEVDAAKQSGFEISAFDHDEYIMSGKVVHNLPKIKSEEQLILRGWMLTHHQYAQFYNALLTYNYRLINSPEQYLNCHHSDENYNLYGNSAPKILYFPNVSKVVFETKFTADFLTEKLLQMKKYFSSDCFILKDSVKSEKHTPDIFKISLNITGEELKKRISKFIEARGKLYSESIMFKEFVQLKEYDGKTNEWRAFILNDNVFGLYQNTGLADSKITKPDTAWIQSFTRHIKSNFFSFDVAEQQDGSFTIIETGDGQVSGLSPQQYAGVFYENLKNCLLPTYAL